MQEFQHITAVLKEYFTKAIVNQAYAKAPFWAQIKKVAMNVYGRRVVIPVQLSFTEGVGARADNDYDLPDADRNIYDRAYVEIKRNYGRIMVDGLSIEATKGEGSWLEIVAAESQGASKAFGMDLDRQSLMDGKGRLAQLSASYSGGTPTVLHVDNPGGVTGDTPETKFLRKGMVIDVYSPDTGLITATALKIASVDAAAATITVSGTTSAILNDNWIYRRKTFVTSGQGEIMGLNGIISTSETPGADFQGIIRANVPEWKAKVITSVGLIDEMVIQGALDELEKTTDGEEPSFILTTYAIRNKIIKDAKDSYQTESMELKYGWKGIKYVGGHVELPIMAHKNVPNGYIFMPSLPHLKFYTLKKLVWDEKGGGVLKPVSSKDAYEAWFKMYGNLGTDCPNAMAVMTGVTVT